MKADVAIVGAGPGGAATALYLLERGLRPLIVEKERFPRYHIGESLTGECGGCLRGLGLEERLLAERYPVKHGVTVYGAGGRNSFWVEVKERTPEGVLRPTWTWQVLRSRFDAILLEAAIERGAGYVAGEAIGPLVEGDRVAGLRIRTPGGAEDDVRSEVLVDASGQATFLANRGVTGKKDRGSYDKQVAIFSQVRGAIRDPGEASGNTLIFYRRKHHWAWFIPLDDELTSVGVVVPADHFAARGLSKPDFLRLELAELNPELAARLPDLGFVEAVRSVSNYSYRVERFTGKGFLCVGDSHRFIDPIFSFGLFFAAKEAQFAAGAIADHLGGATAPRGANPFAAYERLVDGGQDVIEDLVDCFWDAPVGFQLLVHGKHQDDMIDLFAGRIYGDEVNRKPGVVSMRRLLAGRRAAATAGAR